jgi:hypothetical protein
VSTFAEDEHLRQGDPGNGSGQPPEEAGEEPEAEIEQEVFEL